MTNDPVPYYLCTAQLGCRLEDKSHRTHVDSLAIDLDLQLIPARTESVAQPITGLDMP